MLGTSFCDATGWRIVWRDEFEGALNMSRWNVEHGVHSSAGSSADCHGADCHLLGSCRDAACSKDEVNVEGGRLVLSSHRRHMLGRNYTTGAVNTWGKVAWRASAAEGPFRLCTSAILPGVPGRAAGVWPAHWMMPHDDSCDPDEGEMDVMEMVNGNVTARTLTHTWHITLNSHHAQLGHGGRAYPTPPTTGKTTSPHATAPTLRTIRTSSRARCYPLAGIRPFTNGPSSGAQTTSLSRSTEPSFSMPHVTMSRRASHCSGTCHGTSSSTRPSAAVGLALPVRAQPSHCRMRSTMCAWHAPRRERRDGGGPGCGVRVACACVDTEQKTTTRPT